MFSSDILIDTARLEMETGNAIIERIMDSLQGLSVSTALVLLEECKEEIYRRATI